jgi:hypothetical protein
MQNPVYNNKFVRALKEVNMTAASVNGLVIDTFGFESTAFVITLGTLTAATSSNFYTISVQESDSDTFASGNVTVPASRIIGTGTVINDTVTSDSIIKFGVVKGTLRYQRLVFTKTGTADINVSAMAVLGNARHKPVL